MAPLRTLALQRTPPLPDEIGGDGSVLILPMTPVDGQVKDLSGYNNHGTIYGAVEADGRYGKCLSFDGTDDYVEVPDSASLDLTVFTVEFRAYHRTLKNYSGLVIKGLDGLENYELLTNVNGVIYAPILWTDGTRTTLYSPVGVTVVNTWQHFVLTYDGTNQSLFVDGLEVASDAPGKTPQVNAEILTIGCEQVNSGTFGRFLDGLIDSVRIYNRALSTEEIKARYLGGRLTPLRSSGVVR
jgi:hypothetical protein